MLIELVESNRKASRSHAGTLASIALHTGLIMFAIAATANARTNYERPAAPSSIVYIPQRIDAVPAELVEKTATPVVTKAETVASASITAPTTVATSVPGTAEMPAVSEVAGEAAAGVSAIPDGVGALGVETGTGPLKEFEVDRAVRALRTNRPPTYPDVLRALGIEGEVLARYVVDEKGRVDMKTFEVISATTSAFANAVRAALERARFEPAEAAGKKVAQLVEQRFQFQLN